MHNQKNKIYQAKKPIYTTKEIETSKDDKNKDKDGHPIKYVFLNTKIDENEIFKVANMLDSEITLDMIKKQLKDNKCPFIEDFQYSNNAIKLLKSYYDERNLIDKFNEAMKNDYNVAMKLKEGEIVDYYDIIIKEYMVNNELKIVDIVTDVETVEILYYGFIVAHVIETIESEHVTRLETIT